MIEALWDGAIASLSFIGVISTVYFTLLHILRANNIGLFIVNLDENYSVDNLRNLICRMSILNLIFSEYFSEIVLVYDQDFDSLRINEFKNMTDDCKAIIFLENDKLVDYIKRKGIHGAGFC